MTRKPVLAIVSPLLRRDLHDPLRFFSRLDVHHFYAEVAGDVADADWHGREHRYRGAGDLYAKLRALRPDLVQGCEPAWFPVSLPVCRATARLAAEGTPLYFPMLENRPLHVKFGTVGGMLMQRYLRWYAARARFIYAVNAGAADILAACGVPDTKVRRRLYGTWGVDTEEFSPGNTVREPLILFAGRLEAEKGIRPLLAAFARVRQQVPQVRLLFAGDGPLRGDIERFRAEQGLESAIEVRGTVPNRAMPELFRCARITCVPSLTMRGWAEQVGMANIQSMACGTPVVSTVSGAIPEVVGDAGLLVAENDPVALADALEKLMTDETCWHDYSRKCLARATHYFDAQKNITEIEKDILSGID